MTIKVNQNDNNDEDGEWWPHDGDGYGDDKSLTNLNDDNDDEDDENDNDDDYDDDDGWWQLISIKMT